MAVAGATMGVAALPKEADAALMIDGSSDLAYRNLATQFDGSLMFINGSFGGNTFFGGTAVRLNSEYALVAGHELVGTFGSITVNGLGFGPSMQDPLYPVASYTVYPGYDFTQNTPDIAIIKFAQPVPGTDLTIASSSAGDIVTEAGFGNFGTPSGGVFAFDGNARAWNAPVWNLPPVIGSSTYYQSTTFNDQFPEVSLNGKGLTGDSGGPVYNSLGELVGIGEAQSGTSGNGINGINNPFGTTIYLNLSQPDVYSWITSNTVVPEPSSTVLLGLGVGAALFRRHRASLRPISIA